MIKKVYIRKRVTENNGCKGCHFSETLCERPKTLPRCYHPSNEAIIKKVQKDMYKPLNVRWYIFVKK